MKVALRTSARLKSVGDRRTLGGAPSRGVLSRVGYCPCATRLMVTCIRWSARTGWLRDAGIASPGPEPGTCHPSRHRTWTTLISLGGTQRALRRPVLTER